MDKALGNEVDFEVLREHEGDKFYKKGDTRRAREADVKHLIPKVLAKKGEAVADVGDDEGKKPVKPAALVTPAKAEAKSKP